MKIPEIRIYFSWLLYDGMSKDMFEKYAGEGDSLATYDECYVYAAGYSTEWKKYEAKIVPALMSAFGLTFYKSVIDVACAPWISTFSDPLLFNFYNEPDQFVDVLTHELCHMLLTDSTTYSIVSSPVEINLVERWGKLFGEEHDFTTLVHIPVHALCKYIYLDILNEPRRLRRDIEDVKGNEPYKAAWDYVETHDYKKIIEQIKLDFEQLRSV